MKINDKIFYFTNIVNEVEELNLINKFDSITDHSWNYDNNVKHKYFGGQLSKSNKLIQLNDIPDYFNFLISRLKENDIEDDINYIELFSLSGGQELSPSNKHTTISLALRSHQMVKVDNYQLLLEPRSLLLIKDDGPPDIIKGHDRCLNPPPLILNRNLLSIEPYTEFTKSGGELKRTNGFIINFYKIEHILKSLNKLIK